MQVLAPAPKVFDNPSYLRLATLDLPRADGGQAEHDRLLVLLLADVMRVELDRDPGLRMLPSDRVAGKRCVHALRAMRPALERLGLGHQDVLPGASDEEHRVLLLSMQPVSDVHDERMFIRVLQAYEVAFSLVGLRLRAAVGAMSAGCSEGAVALLGLAERTMRECAPLWSLMGTLQQEAFLDFRVSTDGASAIQSRGYKAIESLCRRPDAERLAGPAYAEVPEVRERVLAGAPTFDDALERARPALCPAALRQVHEAMEGFEASILQWRQTHFRIAARMLGDRQGTGKTEGQAYLDRGRSIPLFRGSCPFAADA